MPGFMLVFRIEHNRITHPIVYLNDPQRALARTQDSRVRYRNIRTGGFSHDDDDIHVLVGGGIGVNDRRASRNLIRRCVN